MAWKLKALLDSIAMIAIAAGGIIAQQDKTIGSIIVAVGLAVKAAAEYLYEQGVIVGRATK